MVHIYNFMPRASGDQERERKNAKQTDKERESANFRIRVAWRASLSARALKDKDRELTRNNNTIFFNSCTRIL